MLKSVLSANYYFKSSKFYSVWMISYRLRAKFGSSNHSIATGAFGMARWVLSLCLSLTFYANSRAKGPFWNSYLGASVWNRESVFLMLFKTGIRFLTTELFFWPVHSSSKITSFGDNWNEYLSPVVVCFCSISADVLHLVDNVLLSGELPFFYSDLSWSSHLEPDFVRRGDS